MKTLEEKIKVMQACYDGKPIEYQSKGTTTFREWPLYTLPNFNWENNDYRIKEEPKKKVKLYQVLLRYKDTISYLNSNSYYKSLEEANNAYKNINVNVIKLLPYTEIEVEID